MNLGFRKLGLLASSALVAFALAYGCGEERYIKSFPVMDKLTYAAENVIDQTLDYSVEGNPCNRYFMVHVGNPGSIDRVTLRITNEDGKSEAMYFEPANSRYSGLETYRYDKRVPIRFKGGSVWRVANGEIETAPFAIVEAGIGIPPREGHYEIEVKVTSGSLTFLAEKETLVLGAYPLNACNKKPEGPQFGA
jgi:hypothetical protein